MSESTQAENSSEGGSHGQLSLWDTVSIIVGIVIGSSIFTIPTIIFIRVNGPWEALAVWAFGGFLSFVGALCYAELATTYPRYGGDYVYLTRGLDRPIGFLFGWAQLAVVLSASTGAMAFVFGEYCAGLFEIAPTEKDHFAAQAGIGAVLVLTTLNFFGVVLGKWLQNGLVIIKLLGLALIVIAALIAPATNAFEVTNPVRGQSGIPGAMILVLYAFGGWNDAAFVAADLKDRRNIPKALLLSTVGITIIYLLVNFAYIYGIGFEPARQFRFTMAADVLTNAFGPVGGKIISVVVMISALGAMNGLIYTGSRVYLPLGKDHRVFGFLSYWNKTLKSPILALLAQAAVSIAMIFAVGTQQGRDYIDNALAEVTSWTQGTFTLGPIPWADHFGGFNTLFDGSAPVFWIFFLMTGFSMFALRARDPNIQRPFMLKGVFYPTLPIIFCGMCLFGFWSAITTAGWVSLLGFVPLFIGLPLYWLSGKPAQVGDTTSAVPETPGAQPTALPPQTREQSSSIKEP